MSGFLTWTTILVPLLAAPAALIWGLRRTLRWVVAAAVLLLLAPYIYFGVWAAWEGVSISATFRALSVSLEPAFVVASFMIMWALAYGGVAAGLRWAWLRWAAPRLAGDAS